MRAVMGCLGLFMWAACSPSTGGGNSEDSTIAGVNIPADTPLCTNGGQFTAIGSTSDVAFSWSAVAAATDYAVKLSKVPPGSNDFVTLVERVQPAVQQREVRAGERQSGAAYRVMVVALDGTTALCVVDGVNGVTP